MPTVGGNTICGTVMYDVQLTTLVMLDRPEGLYYWKDYDILVQAEHESTLLSQRFYINM